MAKINFHSLFVGSKENAIPALRFTRETGNCIYDVTILADGTPLFSVNCKAVDKLPVLPSTKQLLAFVDSVREDIAEYFKHGNDTPGQRVAWWAIQKKAKAT